VRYNADGSLDNNFGINGIVLTAIGSDDDRATSVVLQPDGKLVVAGTSYNGSNHDFALARYNSDGSLDLNFSNDGKVTTSVGNGASAFSLILQPDGKLVAAGSGLNGSKQNFALVRYNSDGSLDTSFDFDGKVLTSIGFSHSGAYSLILQPDGKLVAAGCTLSGSYENFALVRYNNDGTLDTSFGLSGRVTTAMSSDRDYASSLILQPDGKLVAAGRSYDTVNYNYDFALARYNSNGILDSSFGAGGKITTAIGSSSSDAVHSLILQPDGKLVATGTALGIDNFVLVRYTSNGSLDIQDDRPLMLEAKPNHALAGQTITLDVQGWDLDDVIGVQLQNAGGSVNGSGLVLSSGSRLTAQLILPTLPGIYDLYLAKAAINSTFKSTFNVMAQVAEPIQWQVSDLGKTGNPIAIPTGLVIGDADGDGQEEIYVANGEARLYIYRKISSWSITPMSQETGYFQDVILEDANQDGVREVYGANSYPRVFQYQWTGSDWARNSFCAYSGPLTKGSLSGGGLTELYAMSGNSLGQSRLFNQNWINSTVGQGNGSMLCAAVGDADNDQVNEVYAANADSKLYQLKFFGSNWNSGVVIYSGSNNITSLAISDQDRDGANELYGSNLDGKIYQFKWNGSYWANQPINSLNLVANKLVISDGDNDGQDEIYAAAQDGHAYQIKLNGSNWQATDLGNAGSPLIALAVGDGDNSHQFKVYAVGANAHVYQFQAAPIPAIITPTPSHSPTPLPHTPTSTVTLTATPYSWSEPLRVACGPNPVRGSVAHLNIFTRQGADVEAGIFTPSGRAVNTFRYNYATAGRHIEDIFVGDLANGIYMVQVKAKNADGSENRVVYKMALIK
jgi:uncharacterized delta-60 repeat protein